MKYGTSYLVREIFQNVSVTNSSRSDFEIGSFDNSQVNIWVLSLNEYVNEPYFRDMSIHNLILDIDLDFFECQEPAATFMNHYHWDKTK